MKTTELPGLIEDGRLDSVLDELSEAVRNRRRTLWDRDRKEEARQAKEQNLDKPGARVELVNLSPKYLNGSTGTTEHHTGKLRVRKGQLMVPVKLDYPTGKFGRQITVPLNCLRRSDTPPVRETVHA